MVRVHLVRHAQSTNNSIMEARAMPGARFQAERHYDCCLSQLGEEQAEAFGQYFKSHVSPNILIYSSGFTRTLQTAYPFSRETGVPVRVKPLVFEVCGPYSALPDGSIQAHPGLSRSQMEDRFPNIDASAVGISGWYDIDKGKETIEKARARAWEAVDWIHAAAAGTDPSNGPAWHNNYDDVFIFTHGYFLDMLMQAFFTAPFQSVVVCHPNTSVTTLNVEPLTAIPPELQELAIIKAGGRPCVVTIESLAATPHITDANGHLLTGGSAAGSRWWRHLRPDVPYPSARATGVTSVSTPPTAPVPEPGTSATSGATGSNRSANQPSTSADGPAEPQAEPQAELATPATSSDAPRCLLYVRPLARLRALLAARGVDLDAATPLSVADIVGSDVMHYEATASMDAVVDSLVAKGLVGPPLPPSPGTGPSAEAQEAIRPVDSGPSPLPPVRAGPPAGVRILDVGSGFGGAARYLAAQLVKPRTATIGAVTAVEMDKDVHAAAATLTARCAAEVGGRVTHVNADAVSWCRDAVAAGGTHCFDAAIALLSLMHMPSLPAVLSSIHAVTARRGLLYVEDFYATDVIQESDTAFLTDLVGCARPPPTVDGWQLALSNAGWTEVEFIDVSERWSRFLADRYLAFEGAYATHVETMGADEAARMRTFYAVTCALFASGRLRGCRIVARA